MSPACSSILPAGSSSSRAASTPSTARASTSLATLDSSGALTASFDVSFDASAITAMALETSTASVILAGDFDEINGSGMNGLARVSIATGTVDPAFNVQHSWENETVDTLLLDPVAGQALHRRQFQLHRQLRP